MALAAVAFVFSYAAVVATLIEKWSSNSVYAYGFVVLLISAYLLWNSLAELRALPSEPDALFGVPVTLAGIAILTVGHLALMTSLQQASLVVTLAGFVLMFFGRAMLARLWFPLAYLLMGLPVWDVAISRLQPASQILSAQLAAVFLHTIGMPVLRDGTRLMLPNLTMEVMRECSGVNQLFAIVAMALPAAYLLLNKNLFRAILVGLAVVVAYLSNGVRIALVGFLAYHGLSNGDLRGVHIFEGLAVSILGYLLLFGCLALLSKIQRNGDRGVPDRRAASSSPHRAWRARLEVGTSIIVLALGVFAILFRPADIRLRDDFRAFPSRIDDWTLDTRPRPVTLRFPAIDDDLVHAYPSAAGERRFSPPDDDLIRRYRSEAGERVDLYVGYQRSQREGKELAGDAGRALNAVASPMRLELGSKTIALGQVVRATPLSQRRVLYWYDLNGRVVNNPYAVKGYMAWDALTRGRTNGAVVMIAWEVPTGADAAAQGEHAFGFAKAVLALLPRYMPS